MATTASSAQVQGWQRISWLAAPRLMVGGALSNHTQWPFSFLVLAKASHLPEDSTVHSVSTDTEK